MKKTINNINFTRKEKIFRKAWLITYLFYFGIVTFALLSCFIMSFFGHDVGVKRSEMSIIAIFFCGAYYLHYYCVYKKMGTKLLLFHLITGVLPLLGSIIGVITYRFIVPATCIFVFYGWNYCVNLLMYTVNEKYKVIKKAKELLSE